MIRQFNFGITDTGMFPNLKELPNKLYIPIVNDSAFDQLFVKLHNGVEYSYGKTSLESDVDVLLRPAMDSYTGDTPMMRYASRYAKSFQSFYLNKFNEFRLQTGCDTILYPKLYFADRTRSEAFNGHRQLIFIDRPDYFIMKDEYGASGGSQVKIPFKYFDMMYQHHIQGKLHVRNAEFFDAYPGCILTPTAKSGNSFIDMVCAQEYVTDIDAEYRVLVYGDEICWYERDRIDDQTPGYVQGNLRDKTKMIKIEQVPVEVYSTLYKLKEYLNVQIGSIDVYFKQGKMGVFEWSNEFGTDCINRSLLGVLHHHWLLKEYNIWLNRTQQRVGPEPYKTVPVDYQHFNAQELVWGPAPKTPQALEQERIESEIMSRCIPELPTLTEVLSEIREDDSMNLSVLEPNTISEVHDVIDEK